MEEAAIMEKVKFNSIEFVNRLREGEELTCPECGKGKVVPVGDPKTTHGFYCTNCDFDINID